MAHEYKEQLFLNLKEHFKGSGWYGVKHFQYRDEIQIILPDNVDIQQQIDELYSNLEALPEIDHPRERVFISFCHEGWRGYSKVLINPIDEKDMKSTTLVGVDPQKWISYEEYVERKNKMLL